MIRVTSIGGGRLVYVDEYAPAQLTERAGAEAGVAQILSAVRDGGAGVSPAPGYDPSYEARSVSCDGCGPDLDEDGACPCCEGARA